MTLLLRGANQYMLDEMDRAMHDALCIVKRVLENHSVVPGGGAVEAALSIHLENVADMLGSREQLAINEFAQAMLVIPKTLAVNAAKDATELVAKLRTYHNHAQRSEDKAYLAKARHPHARFCSTPLQQAARLGTAHPCAVVSVLRARSAPACGPRLPGAWCSKCGGCGT